MRVDSSPLFSELQSMAGEMKTGGIANDIAPAILSQSGLVCPKTNICYPSHLIVNDNGALPLYGSDHRAMLKRVQHYLLLSHKLIGYLTAERTAQG